MRGQTTSRCAWRLGGRHLAGRALRAFNELLFASVLATDTDAQTMQVGARYFLTTYAANYPLAFAATVIGIARRSSSTSSSATESSQP
jgi:hypothetical protein